MAEEHDPSDRGDPRDSDREALEAIVRTLDELIARLDVDGQRIAAAHADAARSLLLDHLSRGG